MVTYQLISPIKTSASSRLIISPSFPSSYLVYPHIYYLYRFYSQLEGLFDEYFLHPPLVLYVSMPISSQCVHNLRGPCTLPRACSVQTLGERKSPSIPLVSINLVSTPLLTSLCTYMYVPITGAGIQVNRLCQPQKPVVTQRLYMQLLWDITRDSTLIRHLVLVTSAHSLRITAS